jgi:hypothetical protein
VRYEDLVRPVVDAHPEGFCKLIVEGRRRYILGAHVLGEYSAEVIQMAAACMAANMRVEQIAELGTQDSVPASAVVAWVARSERPVDRPGDQRRRASPTLAARRYTPANKLGHPRPRRQIHRDVLVQQTDRPAEATAARTPEPPASALLGHRGGDGG